MLSGEVKVFSMSTIAEKVGLTIRQVNNLAYSGEAETPSGYLRVYQQRGADGVRCTTENDLAFFLKSRSSAPDYIIAQEKFGISKNFFYRNKEKVKPFINNNCTKCQSQEDGCCPWDEVCRFIKKLQAGNVQ